VGEEFHGLKLHSLEDIDEAKKKCSFLFSALPNASAEVVEPRFAEAGLSLLSHASCHRMKKEIPLLIPEINPGSLDLIALQKKKSAGFLVAKPNCALMAFLLPLAPLHPLFGIKKIFVTTMQSISGAGNSLPAMAIHDNLIPHIAEEAEKLESEPLKILGDPSIKISAQCNRIPTLFGHFASVSVAFAKTPSRQELIEAWNNFPGLDLFSAPKRPLIYTEDCFRPQTRLDLGAGSGMSVTIGQLKKCPLLDLRFVALSHNTLRGGAGGGVLIGELLHKKGYLS
jgi:aspartate-semialdehyde dehydrogenase